MAWEDTEIVDLDLAKLHAGVTISETDDLLEIYLAQAHSIVLDYVANARDDEYIAEMEAWDSDTAPKAIQAAILRQFAVLRRFRGDDDASAGAVDGNFMAPSVRQLLNNYRDPSLA